MSDNDKKRHVSGVSIIVQNVILQSEISPPDPRSVCDDSRIHNLCIPLSPHDLSLSDVIRKNLYPQSSSPRRCLGSRYPKVVWGLDILKFHLFVLGILVDIDLQRK
jgi:hypothetical protein